MESILSIAFARGIYGPEDSRMRPETCAGLGLGRQSRLPLTAISEYDYDPGTSVETRLGQQWPVAGHLCGHRDDAVEEYGCATSS